MSYFTRRKQYAVTQVARAEVALLAKAAKDDDGDDDKEDGKDEDVKKGGPGSGPRKGGGKENFASIAASHGVGGFKATGTTGMSGAHYTGVHREAGTVHATHMNPEYGSKWSVSTTYGGQHIGATLDDAMTQHGLSKPKSAVAMSKGDRTPLLKEDSEPMQQTAQANQASSAAYQASSPPQPAQDPAPAPVPPSPIPEQIKAHKAAAAAHGAAAKSHRAAGKAAMAATPTVGAAHYQQAQAHDSAQQSHANQAQSMQDQQDQGYR